MAKKKPKPSSAISKYLSQIGSKGGKVKGPSKARSSEQARKAAEARWKKNPNADSHE